MMKRWREIARGTFTKSLAILRFCSLKTSLLVATLSLAEVGAGLLVLYVTKLVIDRISHQFTSQSAATSSGHVFAYLGLLAVLMVASAALQRLSEHARNRQGLEVAADVDRAIHEKAIQVELEFFESPRYHDNLQRARAAGGQRPAQVVGSLVQILRSALYLGTFMTMLAVVDWRLLPLLLVSMLLSLWVKMKSNRVMFDWRHRRAQLDRRASYLDWLLTSEYHAKELRIGHLGAELIRRYSTLKREMHDEQLDIEKRRIFSELAVAAIAALVFTASSALLVYELMQGQLKVGDLVLFLLVFRRIEASGQEFVSSLTRLYDDQLYLGQLFDFLAERPAAASPAAPLPIPSPLREGVKLENVSFRYAGSTKMTLEDINLELRPGKITAIVGENGSGKTSLVKLLCQLYDPTEGRITLDGVDIKSFDRQSYRKLFSVLFQDYARYADTVAENIRYGDVNRPLTDPRIELSAELAGAETFILDLPKGFETPLTRFFDDGRELSIGQWQRVALARALFPSSQFVVMDEPTSAVDARAEAELFDNFRERLGGRGALLISHRLSTIRAADMIYVLERGRIAECGTHQQLVSRGGIYGRLFLHQARQYNDDAAEADAGKPGGPSIRTQPDLPSP